MIFAPLLWAASLPATAFRKDEAGWVYVHLAGNPHRVGYDYGALLAPEIDDAQKALHDELKHETGQDWTYFREAGKLFWSQVDPEYQEEIDGQADALKAKGLPYDRWDVLAMNDYIELADYYYPWTQHRTTTRDACSAFIATGGETSDGKVVVGQNFWWDYQTGERFNVILDITPDKGHRFVMDCYPGFIHSGTDWAINDAGIVITETTLPSIKDFDPHGTPEFVRMRKAAQYAENIDDFARILEAGNDGGYANTWLVADCKNNEIGKLELGLAHFTLSRTKDGYYVGSNFPEDPALIRDELDSWDPDPATNGCEARKLRWKQLLDGAKGQVDANLAMKFLADTVNPTTKQAGATPFTLCNRSAGFGTNNAKVTTSDMVSSLGFWGREGFPDGGSLKIAGPDHPYLRNIQPNPWFKFEK